MLKNVLYTLDFFPRTSETFITNEIIELLRRGIDVKILAIFNSDEMVLNREVLEYGLLDRTTYLDKLRWSRALLSTKNTRLFNTLRLRHHQTNFVQAVKVSYLAGLFRDIEHVHAHFAYQAAVKAMEISQILRKPFTFTAHAYEIFDQSYYSRERFKILAESADTVITPSEFNRKYIHAQTGCGMEKIKIVRATIKLDRLDRRPPKQHQDRVKIVAIGRLVEKKGFEYLIKAMGIVVRKYPATILYIIGSGPLGKELTDLAHNLGLQENVVFLGVQPNEKCLQVLRECHMSVLPCVIARDGDMDVCPLSLQEAMAMAVPVISTPIGSVPELIHNGVEGILVQERNEEALADAIMRLIRDTSLRQAMGRRGREKIEKEFNISIQVSRLLEIFQSTHAKCQGPRRLAIPGLSSL